MGFDELMEEASKVNNNSNIILRCIINNPGVHLRKIYHDLDIPLGTLRYHLEQLEKNGKISSEKIFMSRCYFPIRYFLKNDRNTLKILHNETTREILMYLIEKTCAHQNEIVGNIGITAPSVNWHMQRLSSLGIVSISKNGKHVIYELIIKPSDVVKLLKDYYPKIWRRWSDRLAEMFLNLSETHKQ